MNAILKGLGFHKPVFLSMIFILPLAAALWTVSPLSLGAEPSGMDMQALDSQKVERSDLIHSSETEAEDSDCQNAAAECRFSGVDNGVYKVLGPGGNWGRDLTIKGLMYAESPQGSRRETYVLSRTPNGESCRLRAGAPSECARGLSNICDITECTTKYKVTYGSRDIPIPSRFATWLVRPSDDLSPIGDGSMKVKEEVSPPEDIRQSHEDTSVTYQVLYVLRVKAKAD